MSPCCQVSVCPLITQYDWKLHSSLPTADGICSTINHTEGDQNDWKKTHGGWRGWWKLLTTQGGEFLSVNFWAVKGFCDQNDSQVKHVVKPNSIDIVWCPPGSTGATVWCNKGAPERCRVETNGMMVVPDVSYQSNPQNGSADQFVEAFKDDLWSDRKSYHHISWDLKSDFRDEICMLRILDAGSAK